MARTANADHRPATQLGLRGELERGEPGVGGTHRVGLQQVGVEGEGRCAEEVHGPVAAVAIHRLVVASCKGEPGKLHRGRSTRQDRGLDADVLIQARVRSDAERVQVEVYAVSGDGEEKLWVHNVGGTAEDANALEREIAAAIAAALDALEIKR